MPSTIVTLEEFKDNIENQVWEEITEPSAREMVTTQDVYTCHNGNNTLYARDKTVNKSSDNAKLTRAQELCLGMSKQYKAHAELLERRAKTMFTLSNMLAEPENWPVSAIVSVADEVGYDLSIRLIDRNI